MLVISKTTTLMVTVKLLGLTGHHTKETGGMGTTRAWELLSTQEMVRIPATSVPQYEKEPEYFAGLMVRNMRESIKTENSMVKAASYDPMASFSVGSSSKVTGRVSATISSQLQELECMACLTTVLLMGKHSHKDPCQTNNSISTTAISRTADRTALAHSRTQMAQNMRALLRMGSKMALDCQERPLRERRNLANGKMAD